MPFRARLRVAAVGALAIVALVGCAPGALDVEEETVGASASPSPSATPSASPEPAPSEEPVADGIDTTSWLTYSTHDGDMTYRYPADWTLDSASDFFAPDADRDDVQDPYERWMDVSSLTAPNGQTLLHAEDIVDRGGACPPETRFPIELLASEASAGAADVQIATLAVGMADGRWTFAVGLASPDLVPAPGTTACGWYFGHGSSDGALAIGTQTSLGALDPSPLWTVATLDDAYAYMETEEYATLREILRSVRTS